MCAITSNNEQLIDAFFYKSSNYFLSIETSSRTAKNGSSLILQLSD